MVEERDRREESILSLETPDNPLGNTNDVSALLGESINQVRRGQLDPRVANALGYLTSVLLRALEQGSIEDRLNKIEATLGLAAEMRASDVKTKLERSGQWET
jgi:hypothetical protein